MRATNRIVAALLAAAIATVAVITIIEIVNAAQGGGYSVVNWQPAVNAAAGNTWSDIGARVFAGVLVGVGVILLFLGIRGGRPASLALRSSQRAVSASISRRSLTRALRSTATSADEVARAHVRITRHTVKARATLGPHATDGADVRLRERLQRRLDDLRFDAPPALTVKVKRSGSTPADTPAQLAPPPTAPPPTAPPKPTKPAEPGSRQANGGNDR